MERTILFDGVCNLCNASVRFVIRRDARAKFRFAALQSDTGRQILAQNGLSAEKLDSFMLSENGRIYQRSTAALRVAKELGGAWPLLYAFIVVPPFIRNAVYAFIAARRYRWFGRQESCMLPTPELRARFVG